MSVGSSAGNDALSFAEQLRLKHAEPHTATVEDVADEEDILHPPPSGLPAATKVSAGNSMADLISETAKGKQKAPESKPSVGSQPTPSQPVLDTKSEAAFPSLGGGPKPRAAGPAPTWGAKKAQIPPGSANGINGHGTPSPNNSGSSTPISLPGRSVAAPAIPRGVSLPGKHTESIHFKHPQLLKRQELKKPIPDILRDINRRSKATISMSQRPDGITFEGAGPVDAVRQALKDVASQVGSKQTHKEPIPASVRPFVIGRGGAKISEISKLSGARIQVPKTEDLPFPVGEDDDALVDVSIEGDAVAAQIALDEIRKIVNERTSTMSTRLREIPPELYPFLAGPNNAGIDRLQRGRDVQINIPHYYSWSNQPPPQTSSHDAIPNFIPHPNRHIQLSGDRFAVQEVRAELERQAEQLKREITLSQLPINRGQHQFVVGPDGSSLHDLLSQTGCAVIIPPESDDSEVLYVTGPRSHIERGLEEVMNLASSMQMANVNVGSANDATHARALTRYLQQRRAIDQLERAHNSHIVLPTRADGPTAWEVYSREGKNTIRARTDIMKIVNAYPPTRFRHFEMDPFFHEHLRSQHRERVQRDHGVHLMMPSRNGSPTGLVLVYEGPDSAKVTEPSRTAPTAQEIANFERALRAAEQEILALVSGHGSIESREIEVPQKFHEKVRKFVRNEQQGLPIDVPPLIVTSSAPTPKAATEMLIRGPQDRLDPMAAKIHEFIEQEKRDELERGFILSFEFPQKFANFLIGKRGENINKLRDEFDVEIQVKDGQVELKGPKAKAEACKSRIIAMSKKLEDEATYVLKIAQKYHRELIGAKGTQVQRLQDRYNVRVQFPRSAQAIGDSDSLIDGSDAGTARNSRGNQALDEVIVRGPKKGADACRDELLSLLQYTIDNSQTATVSVAKKQIPQIIGQGGKEMDNIRQATGAKIDIPNGDAAADAAGRVELKIKGTKKQVEDARKLLQEKAKVFDDTVQRSIQIDKKHHKSLIGTGGTNIRQIVLAAGGVDDRRELAKTVRFPQADSDDDTIRIEGRTDIVDKIYTAIAQFAADKANETTTVMEIPPSQHRLLIGSGGETRRGLETQFGIRLDIPKQNAQGAARSRVTLSGPKDKIAAAQAHINELLESHQGASVEVPRRLHHKISNNGQFFRHLRNTYNVTVDHGGQQPPAKPKTSGKAARAPAAAPPLITDDAPTSEDAYSWVVHSHEDDGEESGQATGEIPWILKGQSSDVEAAVAELRTALASATAHTATGYLILPDPRSHRLVIGPGGSQINAIRDATGCRVNVPKKAEGEAIEVIGSLDGVERARQMILEAVQAGR